MILLNIAGFITVRQGLVMEMYSIPTLLSFLTWAP